jgi:mono/diheme cytochrome c family protein
MVNYEKVVKGAMPAWGETEILTEEQIELMACYLSR